MSKRRASVEAGPSGYRPSKVLKSHETLKNLVSPVSSNDSGFGVEDPELQEELAVIEEKLRKAVELYDNNKLTKENVWTLNYIDLFHSLSQLPQAQLDYRFVGQCIAAVTKLYVLRLDQLYDDVYRLSVSLGRQGTGESRKRGREEQPDDLLPQPKRLKLRVKKRSATVTSNPQSLNARLETKPPVDPFFAKVNTHVGDMKQADRMLMNLLPTRGSPGLSLSAPFWDTRDEPTNEAIQCLTRGSVKTLPVNTKNSVIRSTLGEYRITGDNYDELPPTMYINLSDDDSDNEDSALNCQFSCEADTQSVPTSGIVSQEEGYVTQELTQSLNNNETSSSAFIVDMEPVDAECFEYSYRSSNLINNFYAGPSYWKFLKPTTTAPLKRGTKNRTRQRAANLEDLMLIRQMNLACEDSILTTSDQMEEKHHFHFGRKLRLPQDFQMSSSIFEGFENASINMNDPICDLSDSLDFTSSLRQDCAADEDYDDAFATDVGAMSTQFSSTTLSMSFGNKSLMYSKRPRKFNMKRIRDLSLTVIENETTNGNDVSFSQLDARVSKMFRESQESTSCALTFLGILHAASEKKVELRRESVGDSVEDFKIIHTGNSQKMEY